jgi:hypothetical protein
MLGGIEMRAFFVVSATLVMIAMISAGCSSSDDGGGFTKFIGSDSSFGGENTSNYGALLLAAINDLRNAASVAALQSDATADNAMNDYVTVTWTPADNQDFLDPYLIMEHAISDPFLINPANDVGTGDELMDGLGAMQIATPSAVASRWNNGSHFVLVNSQYTHVGIGAADPNARWAMFIFRK